MSVFIFGLYNDPDSWGITEEWIPFGSRLGVDFCSEFDSYESCRKWAIKELISRRKNIGRSIDVWLRRQTNHHNSLLQMSDNTASSAPL